MVAAAALRQAFITGGARKALFLGALASHRHTRLEIDLTEEAVGVSFMGDDGKPLDMSDRPAGWLDNLANLSEVLEALDAAVEEHDDAPGDVEGVDRRRRVHVPDLGQSLPLSFEILRKD